MPIYPHVCQRCQRTEDRFYASFAQLCQEPAVRCLACGSRMERVATTPAFTIKGFAASNGYAKDAE